VESVLGVRRGFFGLIAEGWDLEDTTGKGKRGKLPEEAGEVERIVGLFDVERGSGVLFGAGEFGLAEVEVARVRAMRGSCLRGGGGWRWVG